MSSRPDNPLPVNPKPSHTDFFSDEHTNTSPAILENGTDVAWPAGWTQVQADEWREANHLRRPLTFLLGITEGGEVELLTGDPAVRHKALQDSTVSKTFVYWTGDGEERVTGRVTAFHEEQPFRFSVLPDEATLGP